MPALPQAARPTPHEPAHAPQLRYPLARFLAELCLVRTRSDTQLLAELLALRHQLRVPERKLERPRWQSGDRLVLAALSRLLPEVRLASSAAQP